jgi:hypothetical protein
MSGMTDPFIKSHIEHSSFDDGFAVYARFFKPLGITVTPDGSVIWIADAGNNRIRNISCAGIGAPTFDPTAEPTKRPTADPTLKPSAHPSELPVPKVKTTAAPVIFVAKGGKDAPTISTKETKSSTKTVKGASLNEVGTAMTSSLSGMTSTEIVVLSIAGFVGAVLVSVLLYHRQRFVNFFITRANSKIVTGNSKLSVVPGFEGSHLNRPDSEDDFGMQAVFPNV